ncbi:synaptic vesicle glycoprotein 2C-like isoform X2 [Physella acuta]|uniref:synaptic vesicle glycoprotein 2C-like isoform X2 n=1 Tax=Physella acuta TaxID=109671 RepID=UPI0027DBFDC8|nr:synaptic vesicle glycoprotein 2C-like isoform X2 [Physella acuta]
MTTYNFRINDKHKKVHCVETGWDSSDLMESAVDERSQLLADDATVDSKRSFSGEKSKITIFEDALLLCGFGRFHLCLLLLCGWAVSSDAIEVLSISFLLPSATCDLALTSADKGLLNSIVFLGMLVGGYVWGSLADKWGRRNILVWSLLVNGLGNLGSSVSQTFWLFLVCRFVSGIGVGGSMPVVFTYYTEFQHKSRRGAMISVLATFWMAGNIIAAGLAWVVIPREYLSVSSDSFSFHSWRVFVALCTVPSLTSAAIFVLMPESPKFLLQIGKEQEAIAVLSQVHSGNKLTTTFQLEALVLAEEDKDTYMAVGFHVKRTGHPGWRVKYTIFKLFESTIHLFGKSLRRTTLILLLINFTLAFGYYGLFLWFPELFSRIDKYGGSFCDLKTGNTTDNSTVCDQPGDAVYVESFLTSISNLPGNVLTVLIVDRIGRKPLLASSMVLSGISVFFLWFVKTRWQNVLMSCLFGAISVCGFNMLDVLQTELFPTDVRSTAFGVQTASLRVGAILGNIIFGVLVDTHCAVPMLLVAGLLAFGGLASIALPNTTGRDIH